MNRKRKVAVGKAKKFLGGVFQNTNYDPEELKKKTAYITVSDKNRALINNLHIKLVDHVALDDDGKPYAYNYAFKGKSEHCNRQMFALSKKDENFIMNRACENLRIVGPLKFTEKNTVDTAVFKPYEEIKKYTVKVPAIGLFDKNNLPCMNEDGAPHMVDKPVISQEEYNDWLVRVAVQKLDGNQFTYPEPSGDGM